LAEVSRVLAPAVEAFANVTVPSSVSTPAVAASKGSVTVSGELYADTVTLNTTDSVFTNNGYTELGTVTFEQQQCRL